MTAKPEQSGKLKTIKPHPVWLCVFELAYPTIPTRFPDKPHIRVERKSIRPGAELDAWLKRARANKHPELVRVLSNEMPADHEPGGLRNPFESPRDDASIKNALKKLREKLRCDRYTIGKSQDVWSVYVIELADGHIATKPAGYRGLVYVGQTSLPVPERVKQHRLGKAYPWKGRPKHSTDCHKYFRQYAPELIPEKYRGPIPCRRMALWLERDLREYLVKQGYRVIGGTDLLPKKKPRKQEPPGTT
jgi:hypothetical protein